MSKFRILSNQIKCKKCEDMPYSAHRHDFKECKCGAVAADGGMDYLRRVGNMSDYDELSISIEEGLFDKLMEKLAWCEETGRNDLGRICAIAVCLRDNGYSIQKNR